MVQGFKVCSTKLKKNGRSDKTFDKLREFESALQNLLVEVFSRR